MMHVATGLIEIIQPGLLSTVQDTGRTGLRALGIPLSGVTDQLAAAALNALLGNEENAAVIEMYLTGVEFTVRQGPILFAVGGAFRGCLQRHNGSSNETLMPWRSYCLEEGARVSIKEITKRVAWLALSGGVMLPPVLNSRSTYLRAALGGLEGRALQAGDQLPCQCVSANEPEYSWPEPPPENLHEPVRIIWGPQQTHFTSQACIRLESEPYRITKESDRMGARLEGALLEHISPTASGIESDGITPGAIQVPPDQQPIVLLADCQTVGGYPKIATVISADIRRFAYLNPGDIIRFKTVNIEEARAAQQTQSEWLQLMRTRLKTIPRTEYIDSRLLFENNLISGVVFDTGFDASLSRSD